MYLRRLELQGFKTFAQKTVLEFEPDAQGGRGLTAVVGPNGSGKSNVADSLRWVMGEQSMRLLRSKKSEDVIFSGSQKKSRAGFAEVSMTLVNDDRPELDFSEILITRRLFRDGQSEYEVNKQAARHGDVVMLLAQCGIGQRTYSVIGQGMVDDVLSSSPAERKEFFDEAAGLRPFQLKRQSSLNKLEAAKVNLRQAETVLHEISPRLASLERQVKRLEQRTSLEIELKELETKHYGNGWRQLRDALAQVQARHAQATSEVAKASAEAEASEAELRRMEQATPPSDEFRGLRASLDRLMQERDAMRERQMRLESRREVAKIRAEKPWSALPLSKIIEAIESVRSGQDRLISLLSGELTDPTEVRTVAKELSDRLADLISKLQRPAPEQDAPAVADPEVEREAAEVMRGMSDISDRIRSVQAELEAWNKREEQKRSHIFEVQRQLSRKRQDLQTAEHRLSDTSVELARVETRRDAFLADAHAHVGDGEAVLNDLASQETAALVQGEDLMPRITRVRAQLEWIGGIDPETVKEHTETKARYDDLSVQTVDLSQAITSLETIIKELDQTIAERSATSFRKLNEEFGNYFKKIFGGGEAQLLEVLPDPVLNEQGEVIEEEEKGVVGVEIQATPPGKRLKSISLLSGGERALVSIALICAIMATNPSPFVVLDEVDAALDESNSGKFADIIASLAGKTQFIVVSHNRATMARAHILYGVTMGDDGVSQLLSVKLSDITAK